MLRLISIFAVAMLAVLAACQGEPATPTPVASTPTPMSVPTAATAPMPMTALTGASSEVLGTTVSGLLSMTKNQISWRTSDGGEKSLELQSVEKTFSDALEGKTSKTNQFSQIEVSPSGKFIAFMVATFGGGTAWHFGLATADGTPLGLYSAPTRPRCYIHDYVWRPDDKGVVVEPAGCGGIGRLVLLDHNAGVVYDITTRGIKGILYISPDSRWVALDDGPAARVNRRIEFINLLDPNIRLDLPIDEVSGASEWLEREWIRPGKQRYTTSVDSRP